MARPALKRPVVEYIHDHYGVPWRRACRLMQLHRSDFCYVSVLNPRLELRGCADQVQMWTDGQIVGIGHSSCVLARRLSMGVMSSPYGEPGNPRRWRLW